MNVVGTVALITGGAVRVVDCRGCSMEIVQFLLVGPVNPVKN